MTTNRHFVLDTNTIVSALLIRTSLPRQAFDHAFDRGIVLVSDPITETITDCRDAKDNKFLEVAVCGHADVIITGDQDLLALSPYRGITIITPRDFLTLP